jgi:type II secretion system protein G
MSNKKTSGFTLIELLVVVLVIGALSGILLGVINSSGIRGKARDAQRKADLKKIQTALELYFADNRTYPQSASGAFELVTSGTTMVTVLEAGYIDPVPSDPKGVASSEASPCGSPEEYRYNYRSSGPTYLLTAIMEVSTSNDDSECGSLVGCGAGYATSDVCYVVRNP